MRWPGVCRPLPGGGSGASSGTSVSAGLRRTTSSASRAAASCSGELGDGELAGADVDPGQPPAFAELVHRRQVAVLPGGEERRVGNGAGADDAGDRPLDQTAAGRGHLLGDGDGVSRRQQSPQIVVERVMGDAGHRRAPGAAEGARGQGDTRVPRQDLRRPRRTSRRSRRAGRGGSRPDAAPSDRDTAGARGRGLRASPVGVHRRRSHAGYWERDMGAIIRARENAGCRVIGRLGSIIASRMRLASMTAIGSRRP